VAGVEVGGGREDAHDRQVERVVGEARALEEAAPEEKARTPRRRIGRGGTEGLFSCHSPRLKSALTFAPLLNRRRGRSTKKEVARPEGDEYRAGRSNGAGKGGFSRRSLGSGEMVIIAVCALVAAGVKGSTAIFRLATAVYCAGPGLAGTAGTR
jgi:hypothetical protein